MKKTRKTGSVVSADAIARVADQEKMSRISSKVRAAWCSPVSLIRKSSQRRNPKRSVEAKWCNSHIRCALASILEKASV
jgi:hypothetical protein